MIAEEHPIFRDGLRRLLETEPRLVIVGETGDRSSVPQLVRDLSPDILLLGFSSVHQSLVETLREIAGCDTGVRTIILTGAIHTPEVVEAVQFGAAGVLSKDSVADVLFKSIDSVMDGHYWSAMPPGPTWRRRLRSFNVERRARAFGLTHRELEIVRGDGERLHQQADRRGSSRSAKAPSSAT